MLEVPVETGATIDVVNVTEIVAEAFSSVGTGIGFVFTPHTTASLIISEDDSPDLHEDLELVASEWLSGIGPFKHIKKNNPNTTAHVLSSFGGTHVALPLENGVLQLGVYQNVLLFDFDGPKTRLLRFQFVPSQPLD